MRHSFKVWPQQAEWPVLRDIWIEADRSGFWDATWLNDHLYPPKSPAHLPVLEAWSLLSALASCTTRIRFGTMVSANTFRHPALLAKQATTVDQISGGRLEIGLGTGWHRGEHEAFDIDLPPLRERFDRLEETFAIMHGLMTEEVFSFDGVYHQIREARFEPKPLQRPRPPFVLGGGGWNRTLPMAVRWADQWNFPDFDDDLEAFRIRVERIGELCAEAGRDPATLEVSAQFRYSGDPAEAVDRVAAYRDLGADHVIVSFSPPADATLPPLVAEALVAAG
jgi:F420-dependent oxidoreductase-like protein